MSTNNPSVHYIDSGKIAPTGDHSNCIRFWANIKSQHAAVYGPQSAYNFAACNEHGIRMEGRGWDRDSAANGQQDGVDYNPGSRAIVMLVGGEDILTPQLQNCVNDFANEAYARGMVRPLKAHSDFVATSCCGDNGRALVARINAGDTSTEPSGKKKGSDVLIVGTTDGKWYVVNDEGGSYECGNGVAYALGVVAGVPTLPNQDPLAKVGICLVLAKAAKNSLVIAGKV